MTLVALFSFTNLLKQLHKLIQEGNGDSYAADQLRDKMDLSWKHLSYKEQTLTKNISKDLYNIVDPINQIS